MMIKEDNYIHPPPSSYSIPYHQYPNMILSSKDNDKNCSDIDVIVCYDGDNGVGDIDDDDDINDDNDVYDGDDIDDDVDGKTTLW